MILTKSQLIKLLLLGYKIPDRIMIKVNNRFRHMPERFFIEEVVEKLNYKIEPIRKNLYIIH